MKANSPDKISQEEALQKLILDPDLERLEDLLAEFNLFDVLGIGRLEVLHSAFLAWLLDPWASHGLGEYFLRTFLLHAASEARGIADVSPFDVNRWELADVEVEREHRGIDILVTGRDDEFVCLIENKIGSGEHSGQLSRYLDTVEREYPEFTHFPIFLTPDGREPDNPSDAERYVPFGYGRVAELIERVLKHRGSTINESVASFLQQYTRTLRRHVLETKDNIDELARQIYARHRQAIDLIIESKPASGALGWEIVDAAIEQLAPGLGHDEHQNNYHRFYANTLEEISSLKEGGGVWTESGRILLFEFRYVRDTRMSLHLLIGPVPSGHSQEIRERLFRLAQQTGTPFTGYQRQLKAKWSQIYRRPVLGKEDYKSFDPEKARPKIERAIREFYEKDYWPIVNAIRKEFGLPVGSEK